LLANPKLFIEIKPSLVKVFLYKSFFKAKIADLRLPISQKKAVSFDNIQVLNMFTDFYK